MWRFLRGSSFYFAARLMGAGLAFGLHLLLARWMGSEQLGYYVEAFSWCLILTLFATLGFEQASLRFIAEGQASGDPGSIRGYVGRTRRLAFGAGLLLGGMSAIGMALLATPDDPSVMVNRVAVLCTPILAWISVHSGYAIALSWPRIAMINNVLRPAGLFVAVTVAWAAGGTLTGLKVIWIHAGVMLIVAGIQQVLFERAFEEEVAPAPAQHDTRTWLDTSLPLMLVTLYGGLFFEYTVIFLGVVLPADQIGIFSVAYKVAFVLHFVKWAVDSASLPQLSRLHHDASDRAQLQHELTRATQLQTAVTALGALGIVVLGRPALRMVGPGFEEGYLVMVLLAVALVVRAALGPSAELLGITGHQKTSLAACAAGLLAAPPMLFLLVPSFGLVSAGLTIVLISTAISYWLHREASRRLGLQAWVFGQDTLRLRLRRWLGRSQTREGRRRG